jgi:signal transduction histidine kinase/CheY-like chemotaxis protein
MHFDVQSTLVGHAALTGEPQGIADLAEDRRDVYTQLLYDAGWRSVLAVPMAREGRTIGTLVVLRRTPSTFADEMAGLLQAFADQSALAIVNARLFREVEGKSREVEIASRHKSEFLANMSHELRTPLNAVIGFSEVLLERMFGELNDKQDEYLRDILSSGKHLLELLNDILDLSKVEAGRMELDYSSFSVTDAIDYGLSLVRERATQHGITLRSDVPPDIGVIHADELRFKQVLVNLLSNAVKFTGDRGVVTVSATVEDPELVVTVSDTGSGIAPEDQERIFESFQQGGPGVHRHEGTGLGLTLCRRIVGLHGGRMWVESELGVGSTFGVCIPVASVAAEPVAKSSTVRRPPTAGPRGESADVVVIVDDDPRANELFAMYLEGAGYQAVASSDGEQGLADVRANHPIAVVVDLRLPGMDGWELITQLKADPLTADTPIVVVSVVDERAQGMAMGAAAYLVKPVGREQLVSAVRQASTDASRQVSR